MTRKWINHNQCWMFHWPASGPACWCSCRKMTDFSSLFLIFCGLNIRNVGHQILQEVKLLFTKDCVLAAWHKQAFCINIRWEQIDTMFEGRTTSIFCNRTFLLKKIPHLLLDVVWPMFMHKYLTPTKQIQLWPLTELLPMHCDIFACKTGNCIEEDYQQLQVHV